MNPLSAPLSALSKAPGTPVIAVEKIAMRTRRIQLDQEPRAEQEAPHHQDPSPHLMADRLNLTRQPRKRPQIEMDIGMQIV